MHQLPSNQSQGIPRNPNQYRRTASGSGLLFSAGGCKTEKGTRVCGPDGDKLSILSSSFSLHSRSGGDPSRPYLSARCRGRRRDAFCWGVCVGISRDKGCEKDTPSPCISPGDTDRPSSCTACMDTSESSSSSSPKYFDTSCRERSGGEWGLAIGIAKLSTQSSRPRSDTSFSHLVAVFGDSCVSNAYIRPGNHRSNPPCTEGEACSSLEKDLE